MLTESEAKMKAASWILELIARGQLPYQGEDRAAIVKEIGRQLAKPTSRKIGAAGKNQRAIEALIKARLGGDK